MSIPRTIVVAASRWLRLLEVADLARARSILHNRSSYTDITPTQYATALEWLRTVPQVDEYLSHVELYAGDELRTKVVLDAVLSKLFEDNRPPWLPMAEALVSAVDDIPADMADWMKILGIPDERGLGVLGGYIGRIDLEARRLLGEEGEAGFVALLEEVWPGSTSHVAMYADGLGYDVAFRHEGRVWHLEVKSTRHRSFDRVFVSRNEYEVGLSDPSWVLILLKLSVDGDIQRLATVDWEVLQSRVPLDRHSTAAWESCRFAFTDAEISRGLCSGLRISPEEARLPVLQTGENFRSARA